MMAKMKAREMACTMLAFFVLSLIVSANASFFIERKVTRKDKLPYPSADSFQNPSKSWLGSWMCSQRGCRVRNAKCARSLGLRRCCSCQCNGHVPNFLSLEKGCLSFSALQRENGGACVYNLLGSGSTFIPTITSYLDIESGIVLEGKFPKTRELLIEGTCKATTIYYFNQLGIKTRLVENRCSEVISLKTIATVDEEIQHMFQWKLSEDADTVWKKLKGKLLSMDIECKGSTTKSSCLYFKVGGRYDDNVLESFVRSPRACPTTDSPTTDSPTTTSTRSTVSTRTTSVPWTTTQTPLFSTSTKPVVVPPASLPDAHSTDALGSPTPRSLPPFPVMKTSTEAPSTEAQDKQQGSHKNVRGEAASKHNVKWLLTGLIIAVTILFLILAASISVLLRKRCKKKASGSGTTMMTNVLYHNRTQVPHYDEAHIIPPRPTGLPGEGLDKTIDDCNFYESIDNINMLGSKGATAPTYDYATADAKVELPDKNSESEQLPVPRRRAALNKYDVLRPSCPKEGSPPARANFPPEEYADMSQSASEASPLCPAAREYDNIDDDSNGDLSVRNEMYEDMGLPPEKVPLVPEQYVEPTKVVI